MFLLSVSCYSQTIGKQKANNHIHISKKQSKAYNPKDLKQLAEFIDTLLLDRFYAEIEKFEQNDLLNKNRLVEIVFVGSSSIRKWKSLINDMHGLNVLNRGFGGSTVPEAIYYSEILFLKHKPKKIVFYSGDNDVASLKTSSAKIIKSYIYLYKILRCKLPDSEIFILSIKPSPGRWEYWSQMREINLQLKRFCSENINCQFVDVSSSLINAEHSLRNNLFKKDGVHLNQKGYKIWTDIIYQFLSK